MYMGMHYGVPVEFLNGGNEHSVGTIPCFLSENNPASAVKQIDDNYQHGGGWNNFNNSDDHAHFTLRNDDSIKYPGDPAYKPLARMKLRDETIIVYASAWVAVIQPDRTFEIARID